MMLINVVEEYVMINNNNLFHFNNLIIKILDYEEE